MYFEPHEVLLALSVQFREGLSTRGIVDAIDHPESSMWQQCPGITRMSIEAYLLAGREESPEPVRLSIRLVRITIQRQTRVV
jgi:hypothetical protein